MQWQKITLVGIGLLGGSLGLAVKRHGLAVKVAGYVRRPASVEESLQMGVADEVGLDLPQAVAEADLVILCTPIAQMGGLVEKMLPALKPGALVTDVGSVKRSVVQSLEPLLARGRVDFIGSHPMAGSEQMGVRAARADLFEHATCVVTPGAQASPDRVLKLAGFWKAIGAVPMVLTPELHDELVCRSSHLPHFIAAALASHVLHPDHPCEQPALCATGFRDTTRIASGSPEMWRDIAQANAANLSADLGRLVETLQELRQKLDHGKFEELLAFLATAKQRRDAWCAGNAPSSTE